MTGRDETERLNNIPVWEVGAWLGLGLPKFGSTRCPFPDHEDKSPSFSIDKSGFRWKCFGCDKHGGSIDLVKHFLGCNFFDAKKWLSRSSSGFVPDRGSSANSRPTLAQTASEASCIDRLPDTEILGAFLEMCRMQPCAMTYLKTRAFTSNTIASFSLGYINSAFAVVGKLIGAYGFERVSKSGLLASNATPDKVRTSLWDNSILVPFMERDQIVYLQARAISPCSGVSRWRNLTGKPRPIFNADALSKDSREIWICEGVFDTISAAQLGHDCIGILGVSTNLDEKQITLMKNKLVRIVLDWDDMGQKKAKSLERLLTRFGVFAVISPQPLEGVKDLNEYLVERSRKK